jgi:hypothetical protein
MCVELRLISFDSYGKDRVAETTAATRALVAEFLHLVGFRAALGPFEDVIDRIYFTVAEIAEHNVSPSGGLNVTTNSPLANSTLIIFAPWRLTFCLASSQTSCPNVISG